MIGEFDSEDSKLVSALINSGAIGFAEEVAGEFPIVGDDMRYRSLDFKMLAERF